MTSRKRRFGQSERYRAWPDGFVFVHQPALSVTDEQIAAIAKSLDVAMGSKHVAEVVAAIQRFNGRQIAMAELPAGDHRKRDIETLNALARAMEGWNSNVATHLVRHGADLAVHEPAQIAAAAREAVIEMARVRRRRGRRPRTSEKILFQELIAIYTSATGKLARLSKTPLGEPTGPLFRFIRVAVAAIPQLQTRSDEALFTAVRRLT